MANFNMAMAIIGGRLVDDPKLSTTPSGILVCKFNVAVNTRKGEAQYYTVNAWREGAEYVTKFFAKGSSIGVAGDLEIKSWKGSDGTNKRTNEINAVRIFRVDSHNETTVISSTKEKDFELAELADDDEIPF